jgi:argininosuccinate synthase
MASRPPVRRVCLAYSGGLDTSVILKWLIEHYDCEVVAYCADIGQEEELSGLPDRAKATGAADCVVVDARDGLRRGRARRHRLHPHHRRTSGSAREMTTRVRRGSAAGRGH